MCTQEVLLLSLPIGGHSLLNDDPAAITIPQYIDRLDLGMLSARDTAEETGVQMGLKTVCIYMSVTCLTFG